jgi:guanylate kinase
MEKGLLIVVSGPSGAGKGTVCSALLQAHQEIELSVSATTREPRKAEIPGVSYHYMQRESFIGDIEKDAFLEYAEVYGNYYGTPKKFVLDALNRGKDVLLEIDIQGALKVKENYPEGVFVFILPPSLKELENRITLRGTETEESLKKRLGSALKEIEQAFKYEYCIVNDRVDQAVEELEAILMAERCLIKRNHDRIHNYKEENYHVKA